MFHLRLWKMLAEVASAHCNARVYMLTFMLDRRKNEAGRADEAGPSGGDDGRPG
ncbi:MAG: hypothetical protein ACOZAM_15960 [Pseudomonadota bacterium]